MSLQEDNTLTYKAQAMQENKFSSDSIFKCCYNDRLALIQDICDRANRHGCVLTVRSSDENRVTLICDRGCSYRYAKTTLPPVENLRNTSSKKVGCTFCIKIKLQRNNDWKAFIKNEVHNHTLDFDLSGHSTFRSLHMTPQIRNKVFSMWSSGIRPRHILSILQNEAQIVAMTRRDIYNIIARERKKRLVVPTRLKKVFEAIKIKYEECQLV